MITEFRDIDNLSPGDFEIFVREVFIAAGWKDAVITRVGTEYRHGDGGVDIFAYKAGRKCAIEVKQRNVSTAVDVSALNQLVTGAQLARAENKILVTNSYFTSEVQFRALRLGVELVDRDELQNLWVKKHSEIGRDIRPRTYQESVISDCIDQYRSGKTKLLIEMATGLGKTYTVALIIKRLLQISHTRLRVLLIAHQVEILLQSVTAFKNVFGIGNYSFSACFSGAEPEDTDFVFATFDTLYSQIHALQKDSFDLIIVDEAHHTPARTYSEVVQNFHPKLLIGLTATPYRMDNINVLQYFGGAEGHIGKYDLTWALRHNKLAFPKYMVMLDDLDQNRLNQLQAGLSVSDLDRRLFLHKKDEEVVNIVEQTIKEKNIANPKGIVFCRSIAHMKHLIQFFKMGSATMVHSKMLDQERRDNIRKFRENAFRFILVCDLFNEGIDIPETSLLLFMRYTGSRTIWLQQLGRGLRKTPNKEYVHVLDFVGSLDRLNDVKYLQKAIKEVPLDKGNWEKPPRDNDRQPFHDATLEVTYNQSAAQVLKLLDELEYRLKYRQAMIEQLQSYVDNSGEIPAVNEIEDLLHDVTCDQISTHFDSYFGYLMAVVPDEINKQSYKDRINCYVSDFIQRYSVVPSRKAVSLAFKYKSLVELSEQDIIGLVGNTFEPEVRTTPNSLLSKVEHISADPPNHLVQAIETKQLDGEQKVILQKYAGKISSSKDIERLQDEERAEIKCHFISIFYFLKLVKNVSP